MTHEPTPRPRTGWHIGPLLGLAVATTGLDAQRDRVVATALVAVNVPRAFRTTIYFDAGDVPVAAANVHGISTAKCRRDGREPRHAFGEIAEQLQVITRTGIPLVVFNAQFALTVLDRDAQRHAVDLRLDQVLVVDPFVLDRHSHPNRPRGKRTLRALCQHYQIFPGGRLGRPEPNAVAVLRVAWAYATRHPQVAGLPLPQLHEQQRRWHAEDVAEWNSHQEAFDRVARRDPAWPYLDAARLGRHQSRQTA